MHFKNIELDTPRKQKAVGLKSRGISKAISRGPKKISANKKRIAAKSQSKGSTRDSSSFSHQQPWQALGCNDEEFSGSIYSVDSDTDLSVYSEPLCDIHDLCLENSHIGHSLGNAM